MTNEVDPQYVWADAMDKLNACHQDIRTRRDIDSDELELLKVEAMLSIAQEISALRQTLIDIKN